MHHDHPYDHIKRAEPTTTVTGAHHKSPSLDEDEEDDDDDNDNFVGCGKPVTEAPTTSKRSFAVSVSTSCIDGHHFTWYSQPFIGNIFAGNLIFPASLFLSGNSYSTFLETCTAVSLQSLTARQCYNIQRLYHVAAAGKQLTL